MTEILESCSPLFPCWPKTLWSISLRQVYVLCRHKPSARRTQRLDQTGDMEGWAWNRELATEPICLQISAKSANLVFFFFKNYYSIIKLTIEFPSSCVYLLIGSKSWRKIGMLCCDPLKSQQIIEDLSPCPRMEVLWSSRILVYTLGQLFILSRERAEKYIQEK